MNSIKKTVIVTTTKKIEIELTAAVFSGLTLDEYLAEFRKGLWPVEGIDDVIKYAAECAASGGSGYQEDGLGLVSPSHWKGDREGAVKFNVLEDECEVEVLS
jgi:hypothetical protein